MNPITIFLCVCVALIVLIVLLAIGVAVFWWVRQLLSGLREVITAMADFRKAITKLSDISDPLGKVPEYMKGHARAAEATALQIGRLNQTIDKFSALLIDPKTSKQALSVPTEEEKNRYFTVSSLVAGGMSLQEAETAAENESLVRGSLNLGIEGY